MFLTWSGWLNEIRKNFKLSYEQNHQECGDISKKCTLLHKPCCILKYCKQGGDIGIVFIPFPVCHYYLILPHYQPQRLAHPESSCKCHYFPLRVFFTATSSSLCWLLYFNFPKPQINRLTTHRFIHLPSLSLVWLMCQCQLLPLPRPAHIFRDNCFGQTLFSHTNILSWSVVVYI